jgi:predicted enzyme related to lactoylglutathione lyase
VYYIRVENLERALEAVKAGGGQIVNGPIEVPGGDTVVNCTDPQGALFALHQKHVST